MDSLYLFFPISGVTTWVFIPPLVAFVISFFTSMGGVSGAFLILPFQVSCLGFAAPSVSATNLLYNVVAIPSGVYRYLKEGRMAWPLASLVIIGTLPGILMGYYLRVLYLPDPREFKLFVGCVLLYMGTRLFFDTIGSSPTGNRTLDTIEKRFNQHFQEAKESRPDRIPSGLPSEAVVKTVSISLYRVDYEFWGERFSFSTPGLLVLAFLVGVVGGTYGIGGGAIIAPFCVSVFQLPVYTVAGAALMGTFLTSIAGVLFYTFLPAKAGLYCGPDWLLGLLFGIGGFAGVYCGARFQKFVPQKYLKLMLGILILFLAGSYIIPFLLR